MNIDVMGLLGACSYALDCVEAELTQVTNQHSKRVAYLSVCIAEQMHIPERELQDLAVCALLHDNALTQYIREELHGDITSTTPASGRPLIGIHCSMGESNLKHLPFLTDVKDVILYHHENADGSGPFGKTWQEIPLFARIIHLCDLLDVYCRVRTFTADTWQKTKHFLSENTDTLFDAACRHFLLRLQRRISVHSVMMIWKNACGLRSPGSDRSLAFHRFRRWQTFLRAS